MHNDKLRPAHWRDKLIKAWLVIALAPVLPLYVLLVALKVWDLAWPIVVATVVLVVGFLSVRLVRWRRWR